MSQAHLALRHATARHHAAAEDAFATFDLAAREGYRRFLLAQARAVLPLEDWLDATSVSLALPDWAERRRGHLLARDLAALGTATPACSPVALPGDPLGAVYVLEGSRFGGRLLGRRARASEATLFLCDPGVQGGWRAFWDAVERELAGGRRTLGPLIEAAEAAFAFFVEAASAVAATRRNDASTFVPAAGGTLKATRVRVVQAEP